MIVAIVSLFTLLIVEFAIFYTWLKSIEVDVVNLKNINGRLIGIVEKQLTGVESLAETQMKILELIKERTCNPSETDS